jgi:hypothetical protein
MSQTVAEQIVQLMLDARVERILRRGSRWR